jgi:hypothetical protein
MSKLSGIVCNECEVQIYSFPATNNDKVFFKNTQNLDKGKEMCLSDIRVPSHANTIIDEENGATLTAQATVDGSYIVLVDKNGKQVFKTRLSLLNSPDRCCPNLPCPLVDIDWQKSYLLPKGSTNNAHVIQLEFTWSPC